MIFQLYWITMTWILWVQWIGFPFVHLIKCCTSIKRSGGTYIFFKFTLWFEYLSIIFLMHFFPSKFRTFFSRNCALFFKFIKMKTKILFWNKVFEFNFSPMSSLKTLCFTWILHWDYFSLFKLVNNEKNYKTCAAGT